MKIKEDIVLPRAYVIRKSLYPDWIIREVDGSSLKHVASSDNKHRPTIPVSSSTEIYYRLMSPSELAEFESIIKQYEG